MSKPLYVEITNKNIYEMLEGSFIPTIKDQDNIKSILLKYYPRFKCLLNYYKKPSQDSKKQLENQPEISIQNENIKLSSDVCKYVLSLSELLNLDELQSLELYGNYITHHYSNTKKLPNISDLLHYYNEERIYLLECIVSLFRNCSEETSHPSILSTVQKLYNDDNIVSNVIDQYSKLIELSSKIPSHLNHEQGMIWVNQIVAEQTSILRILFYIFFDDNYDCSILPEIVILFQKQDFGSKQPHYALLNEKGRENILTMNYLCSLILVESFQLEKLFSEDEKDKNEHFLITNYQITHNIHTEIHSWIKNPISYHGPVFLAWTAVCYEISRYENILTLDSNSNNSNTLEYIHVLSAALSCGAFSFLKNLLQISPLSNDKLNLLAFKSVLRGLILALFTAFTVENLLREDPYLFVDLYCELFKNQPELCNIFWEEDFQDTSRGVLLELTKKEFPNNLIPFIKIITSLAGDKDLSQKIFYYLKKLDTYTIIGDSKYRQYIIEEHKGIVVQQPFQCQGVPLCYETHGYYRGKLITWYNMQYSAWNHFHYRLYKFSSQLSKGFKPTDTLKCIRIILELIHTLVSQNNILAVNITSEISKQSHKPSWCCIFLQIYSQLSLVSPLTSEIAQVLSLCLYCLADFAHTHAQELWSYKTINGISGGTTRGINIIQNNNISSSILQSMANLLHHYELPTGNFCFTLPFLQFLKIILIYIQRWTLPVNSNLMYIQEDFSQYLDYIRLHILVSFNTWKYSKISERWEIGLLLIDILYLILTDIPYKNNISDNNNNNNYKGIKYSLLQWLLYDSSFHNVILNIISSGSETLIKLRSSRVSHTEIYTLEKLILRAFKVLECVLLEREGISKGESSLEHALMSFYSQEQTQKNFIIIISYFILYKYNRKLPLIATRILKILCKLSLLSEFSQRRPSLVAYLGNNAQSICIKIIKLLKTKNECLSIEILQLISIAFEYQLGLAEMFIQLDKDSSINIINNNNISSSSHNINGPVTIIRDILQSTDYPCKQPKLYSAAINVLHALWEFTPEHSVVQKLLRNNKDFWNNLLKPLLYIKNNEKKIENQEDKAYYYSICNWSLRILSLELYNNRNAINTLNEYINLSNIIESNLLQWCKIFSKYSLKPFLLTEFEEISSKNNFDLSLFWKHNYSLNYGTCYLYNTSLVKRKLFDSNIIQLHSFSSNNNNENIINNLKDIMENVNNNLSLFDSQLCTFKALQVFIQLISGHSLLSLKLCKIDSYYCIIKQLSESLNYITDIKLLPSQKYLELLSELIIHLLYQCNNNNNNNNKDLLDTYIIINNITHVIEKCITSSISSSQIISNENNNILLQLENIYIPHYEIISKLFLCILLLISYDMNNKNKQLFSSQDNKNQESSLIKIIPLICIGCSCEELKKISFTLLSIIIKEISNTDNLISYFHKYNMFKRLINSFNYHSIDDFDSVIQVLLSLASNPTTAQELLSNNIMFMLCDTSQDFFQQNITEPYKDHKRNIYHIIWCNIIRIVIHMSYSLSNNDLFHQQLYRFIIIHQELLFNKWNIFYSINNIFNKENTNDNTSNNNNINNNFNINSILLSSSLLLSLNNNYYLKYQSSTNNNNNNNTNTTNINLSIGILEELECVCSLYNRWVHTLNNWKLGFNPQTIEITFHLRYIFQYFILTLLKPSELLKQFNPMTEKEQKQKKTKNNKINTNNTDNKNTDNNNKNKNKNKNNNNILQSPLDINSNKMSIWTFSNINDDDKSLFQNNIEQSIHKIISHCLSYILYISPKTWSYHFDPSNIYILFTPNLEPSNIKEYPCLGILLYCSVLSSKILEKYSKDNEDNNNDNDYKTILEHNFYHSLSIILLQLSIYQKKSNYIQNFNPIQLKNYLERLKQKLSQEKQKNMINYINYSIENIKLMIK